MAVAAHPDDIEFMMAGTLLLLKEAGFEIHYMTVSSGNCGSMTMNSMLTRRMRRRESIAAARILDAEYHPSLTDDLEIFYDLKTLRRLSAVVRKVAPEILLVPSPQDYMEDHTNTCRLAVTAAFARGMPNFKTTPTRRPMTGDLTLYHAMPHGLRDALRQPILPELFIDTTKVHAMKRRALAAHESQRAWLDASQGMDSYLKVMDEMSLEVGRMSRRFKHAEGWRRHSHLGFSGTEIDPLFHVLKQHAKRIQVRKSCYENRCEAVKRWRVACHG
jgi:N-acetylglucosamine malate deacetylase 1